MLQVLHPECATGKITPLAYDFVLYCSIIFSKTLISLVSQNDGAVITLTEGLQMSQFYFALLKADRGI